MLGEKQIDHRVRLERSKYVTWYAYREENWSQGMLSEKQIGHKVRLERGK